MPDEVAGTPLLAVLSTVVLDADNFRSVSAVLTVGLLDDEDDTAGLLADAESDRAEGAVRYLLPTPDRRLALLAEFTVTGTADDEIQRRIDSLMASFRWAA